MFDTILHIKATSLTSDCYAEKDIDLSKEKTNTYKFRVFDGFFGHRIQSARIRIGDKLVPQDNLIRLRDGTEFLLNVPGYKRYIGSV